MISTRHNQVDAGWGEKREAASPILDLCPVMALERLRQRGKSLAQSMIGELEGHPNLCFNSHRVLLAKEEEEHAYLTDLISSCLFLSHSTPTFWVKEHRHLLML